MVSRCPADAILPTSVWVERSAAASSPEKRSVLLTPPVAVRSWALAMAKTRQVKAWLASTAAIRAGRIGLAVENDSFSGPRSPHSCLPAGGAWLSAVILKATKCQPCAT